MNDDWFLTPANACSLNISSIDKFLPPANTDSVRLAKISKYPEFNPMYDRLSRWEKAADDERWIKEWQEFKNFGTLHTSEFDGEDHFKKTGMGAKIRAAITGVPIDKMPWANKSTDHTPIPESTIIAAEEKRNTDPFLIPSLSSKKPVLNIETWAPLTSAEMKEAIEKRAFQDIQLSIYTKESAMFLRSQKGCLNFVGFWMGLNDYYETEDERRELPVPNSAKQDQTEAIAAIQALEKVAGTTTYNRCSQCRICGNKNRADEYFIDDYVWPGGYLHYIIDHNVAVDEGLATYAKMFNPNTYHDTKFTYSYGQ